MMTKTTEQILKETKELLNGMKGFKPKRPDSPEVFRELDIRYPRVTKIYCVLVPENFEWARDTFDFYEGDRYIPYDDDNHITVVRHGHPVGLTCFAPNFCHVVGYRPKGNESPV